MNREALRRVGRVPHGGSRDPDLVDFSANTNPLTPDGVARVYGAALGEARSYPDDGYPRFRAAAGAFAGCDPDAVVPTSGALSGIRLALEACVESGETALVPVPSFGEYAREVRLQGATPEFVPHDALLDADPEGHALAILCRPNNPTGTWYDEERVRAFLARCREAGVALLVDEAFVDFADRPSLASSEGAIVVRSLTKVFGLPGLRAGFLVASDLYEPLEAARPTWNVGTPAAAVGEHCMHREGFVAETRERVRRERARIVEALSGAYAIEPSKAPFLLLDVGDRDVDRVIEIARDEGVAIRDARTFRGLDSHVRVAVRLPRENDQLIEAMRRAADA